MTGDMLIAAFFQGRPPRRTKLAASVWQHAANIFAESGGRVKLRELCDQCKVSHRTAWRIRDLLRDAAQAVKEQEARNRRTHFVSKEHRDADRNRPQVTV